MGSVGLCASQYQLSVHQSTFFMEKSSISQWGKLALCSFGVLFASLALRDKFLELSSGAAMGCLPCARLKREEMHFAADRLGARGTRSINFWSMLAYNKSAPVSLFHAAHPLHDLHAPSTDTLWNVSISGQSFYFLLFIQQHHLRATWTRREREKRWTLSLTAKKRGQNFPSLSFWIMSNWCERIYGDDEWRGAICYIHFCLGEFTALVSDFGQSKVLIKTQRILKGLLAKGGCDLWWLNISLSRV